jgi:dTDP-4-dehydrorhamnose 3,5-epimerase
MLRALMSLRREDVGARWRDHLTVQDYSAKPQIDGVRFLDLTRFVDDGGSFLELGRLSERGELFEGFGVRQINYSTMLPGAVKAFHLHLAQNEIWFVPAESRLLLGLLDVRAASKTRDVSMRFVLGGGRSRAVYIPHGVAHGAANLSGATAPIIYMADRQFSPDPEKTDEHRLPWDVLGAAFWQMERG